VADKSNSYTSLKRWKATCLKYKIPFHAIAEKGFYKM
jgi:competence protein ComEC